MVGLDVLSYYLKSINFKFPPILVTSAFLKKALAENNPIKVLKYIQNFPVPYRNAVIKINFSILKGEVSRKFGVI